MVIYSFGIQWLTEGSLTRAYKKNILEFDPMFPFVNSTLLILTLIYVPSKMVLIELNVI